MSHTPDFTFKRLKVWHKSMEFTHACLKVTEALRGHYRLKEQLEGCAASVPQNIAEGEGRTSVKEKIHYLYIARGSLYEAITLLNILYQQGLVKQRRLTEMETLGMEVAKMLNKLISSKRKFSI